jgi:hypothetical protein
MRLVLLVLVVAAVAVAGLCTDRHVAVVIIEAQGVVAVVGGLIC